MSYIKECLSIVISYAAPHHPLSFSLRVVWLLPLLEWVGGVYPYDEVF